MNRLLLVWSANPYCTSTPFGMKTRIREFCDELSKSSIGVDLFRVGNYSTVDWGSFPPGQILNPPSVDRQTMPKSISGWKKVLAGILPSRILPHAVNLYAKISGFRIFKEPSYGVSNYDAVVFVTAAAADAFPIWSEIRSTKRVLLLERSEAVWNSFGAGGDVFIQNLVRESKTVAQMSAVIHSSMEEQALFNHLNPLVPSFLFPPSSSSPRVKFVANPRFDFLLFGHDHQNNVVGANSFLDEVAKQERKYSVAIAGSLADSLAVGAYPWVTNLGKVSNVQELYQQAAISVSFAAVGDGVKTKVIESFAHGVPVLANVAGASGLVNKSSRGLHIHNSNTTTFSWVNSLLGDIELRREAFDAVRQEVTQHYSELNVRNAVKWLISVIKSEAQ